MTSIDAKNDYQKLLALPGVFGVMIINKEGLAVKTNLNQEDTLKYSSQIAPLVETSAKFMKELAGNDDNQTATAAVSTPQLRARQLGQGKGRHAHDDGLSVIRIRTLHYEILVCPCIEGGDYIMVALQKPPPARQDDAEWSESPEKADK